MTDYEKDVLKRIADLFESGKLSNDFLVENIKLSGNYLNLQTVSDYAKSHNMSYPAALKDYNGRKNIDIFGVKFVIDNE